MKYRLIVFLLSSVIGYFSQGLLYQSGLINQVFLTIILSINLFYWIKVLLLKKKDYLITIVSLFLFINIIWLCINLYIKDDNQQSIYVFKIIFLCLSSIFPFYYLGINGIDIKPIFNIFFILFFILSCLFFHYYQRIASEERNIVNFVNNYGYNFVLLLPLLLLLNKKTVINIGFILIIIFYTILSAKRGALISLICGIIVYVLYQYKELNLPNTKMRRFFIIVIIFLFMGFLSFCIKNNEFFMFRWENISNNTSNRDVILESLYNFWVVNYNVISLIFGFGLSGTIYFCGNFAHNDFIEVIFDYGILGFIFYISILCILFCKVIHRNVSYSIKYSLLSTLIIWLSKGMTTGVITGDSSLLLTIVIGYSYGLHNHIIKMQKISQTHYK